MRWLPIKLLSSFCAGIFCVTLGKTNAVTRDGFTKDLYSWRSSWMVLVEVFVFQTKAETTIELCCLGNCYFCDASSVMKDVWETRIWKSPYGNYTMLYLHFENYHTVKGDKCFICLLNFFSRSLADLALKLFVSPWRVVWCVHIHSSHSLALLQCWRIRLYQKQWKHILLCSVCCFVSSQFIVTWTRWKSVPFVRTKTWFDGLCSFIALILLLQDPLRLMFVFRKISHRTGRWCFGSMSSCLNERI